MRLHSFGFIQCPTRSPPLPPFLPPSRAIPHPSVGAFAVTSASALRLAPLMLCWSRRWFPHLDDWNCLKFHYFGTHFLAPTVQYPPNRRKLCASLPLSSLLPPPHTRIDRATTHDRTASILHSPLHFEMALHALAIRLLTQTLSTQTSRIRYISQSLQQPLLLLAHTHSNNHTLN